MANDTTYGLASYVYTRDIARAMRVVEALQFGIVGINDINPTSAAAPFGGSRRAASAARAPATASTSISTPSSSASRSEAAESPPADHGQANSLAGLSGREGYAARTSRNPTPRVAQDCEDELRLVPRAPC